MTNLKKLAVFSSCVIRDVAPLIHRFSSWNCNTTANSRKARGGGESGDPGYHGQEEAFVIRWQ